MLTNINRPPHRSMMNTDSYGADMAVMNPYHQERPLCGASIGAFNGEHLPPVSYGGVILVDDEPLGMSVHHLLDAPSDDEDDVGDEPDSPYPNEVMLSSAANNPWLMGMGAQPDLYLDSDEPAGMWDLELSDDEDMKSEDDDADVDSFDFSDSELESDDDSAEGMLIRYFIKVHTLTSCQIWQDLSSHMRLWATLMVSFRARAKISRSHNQPLTT